MTSRFARWAESMKCVWRCDVLKVYSLIVFAPIATKRSMSRVKIL